MWVPVSLSGAFAPMDKCYTPFIKRSLLTGNDQIVLRAITSLAGKSHLCLLMSNESNRQNVG